MRGDENQKHTCRALTLGTFATLRHPSWPEKTTIKIPLTFPFGRIRFNNVSAKAVFHGSHPIMFSDRPLKDALCNTRWITFEG